MTAAALALPGLAPPQARAASGNEFTFDYRHYDEGARDLAGPGYADLNLKPIEVDSAALNTQALITDRLRLALDYTQDTWSGATPVVTVPVAAISDQLYSGASAPLEYFTDSGRHPVNVDWNSYDGTHVKYTRDPRSVHVMASASPETRRQIDLGLDYEWSSATLKLGGGVSDEPDYLSTFVNMSGSRDFNQKQTTVSGGWSYTTSDISASLEANTAADWGAYQGHITQDDNGVSTLHGKRRDLAFNLGLTQILGRNSLIEGSLGYTRSSGYLSNPYKAAMLAFDDPDQFIDSTGLRVVTLKGVLEERPRLRNQWTVNLRYAQYVEKLDGSLHANYRYFRDDWGIDAHTFELNWHQPLGAGWMIVPGARYYTQSQADFYRPYYVFEMAYPGTGPIIPGVGRQLDHSRLPLHEFASDERLSGYGTATAQLALSRQFSRGARVEIGAEYFRHAGSLKLGGGGEGRYADFDAWTLFAELNVDLSAPAIAGDDEPGGGPTGPGRADAGETARGDAGTRAPAGVSRYQLLTRPGAFRIDYRHLFDIQEGHMRRGTSSVEDAAIVAGGCGAAPCYITPSDAQVHVNAFDFTYALRDWLNLVLETQVLDKDMDLRPLDGAPLPLAGINHPGTRTSYTRRTGGLGDVALYGLVGLWRADGQQLNAGLGISAPTGSVHKRLSGSGNFNNYGMQPGSGTLDLRPSLSYTGSEQRWSWGAQLSGIKRLEGRNESGYALGGRLEATAWGSYDLFDWLSASLRGVYTAEGRVRGEFDPHRVPQVVGYRLVGTQFVAVYGFDSEPNAVSGPMDVASNYGGQRVDIGFGLSAEVPGGDFAGNRIGVEWLQPIVDDVNGYQLAHTGSLMLSWSLAFF